MLEYVRAESNVILLSVGSAETLVLIVNIRPRETMPNPKDADSDLQEVSCDLAQHYLAS